jgi:hypothetical protein
MSPRDFPALSSIALLLPCLLRTTAKRSTNTSPVNSRTVYFPARVRRKWELLRVSGRPWHLAQLGVSCIPIYTPGPADQCFLLRTHGIGTMSCARINRYET